MDRKQLEDIFKDIDSGQKKIIESMFDDFIYEINQLNLLKPQIESMGIPKSKVEADKKKYLTKEYSDISQRHDGKIKIFLAVLRKEDGSEESPLMKMLKKYE